jgi:proteasome assembly chaperone (PAC2) family protein
MPDLHDPIAVLAFSGWNDAASAATDAARFVVRRLGARRFAHIDAEDFYDFTSTRPEVQITPAGRHVNWPKNEFFFARNPIGPHDVVVAVGVEPDLAWRRFAGMHLELYEKLGASLVVSLGALLADVPHTRPSRVTGTALDPAVAERLDLTTSRYEGPTGIVGMIHDTLRQRHIAAASLWANVPHYITTSQNPAATVALLRRLDELLGVAFDVRELETSAERFVKEVDTALAENSEIADYVRRLEAAYDEHPEAESSELPASEDLVLDIEDFLRRQRED